MNKTVHKIAAAVLAALMLSTCASAADFSSNVFSGELALSDTTGLTSATQADADKAVQENVVTYSPDRTVLPIVAYGTTLYGRSAITAAAKYLSGQGYSIVAGVNAAFFDMNTGMPYGLVVTDGLLRTSGDVNSVGFFDNGTAVIGKPGLSVKLTTANGTTDLFYNKTLTAKNGIGLYSNDYDTRTKSGISAWNVVLTPTSGKAELTLNGSMEATVAGPASKAATCPIPAGSFVLSVAEASIYQSAVEAVQSLKKGDTVTIQTASDPSWQNVLYACGGGDLLVENGQANSSFTLETADKSVARTAVGLKQDGTVVFYTADYGVGSVGLTLPELAARMLDLGCTTALNLDGGGSTAMGAHYPGFDTPSTVNQPSDGSLRKCANFLFLVRKTTAAGPASRLYVYPYHASVLAGASLQMTAKAADANYMTAAVPAGLTYAAAGGTVTDAGVFTAASGGTATVTAQAGGLSGSANVNVVSEPTAIRLKKEDGKSTFTTAVLPGESVTKLTALAYYYGAPLTAQDACFTWSVTGDIGTVDAEGTFTAASVTERTSGTITASCGSVRAEAAVTVCPKDPFSDMKTHWAKDYVNSLYFNGVLTGSTDQSGSLVFRPDDSMTRQEFIVSLIRYLGVDTASFTSYPLPFADNGQIASWAKAAVQTACALGYVGGSGSGGKLSLRPDGTISRQEAMTILARSKNLSSDSADATLKPFSDASKVASWAQSYLAAMVEKGVISGSNGKLKPTADVTRAEIAKMLDTLG
jgi:exopolysaccharide biosynthesis protein